MPKPSRNATPSIQLSIIARETTEPLPLWEPPRSLVTVMDNDKTGCTHSFFPRWGWGDYLVPRMG